MFVQNVINELNDINDLNELCCNLDNVGYFAKIK
jgi:hypothetical protein